MFSVSERFFGHGALFLSGKRTGGFNVIFYYNHIKNVDHNTHRPAQEGIVHLEDERVAVDEEKFQVGFLFSHAYC